MAWPTPAAQTRLKRRKWLDRAFYRLMLISAILVVGSLLLILGIILGKSLPALKISMITRTPGTGYYLGQEGGILNAIVGSLEITTGATLLAIILAWPGVIFLNTYLKKKSARAEVVRLMLDILWGIPSIVYGAFGFLLMLTLHLRASLLAGMVTLALVELPVLARSVDETMRLVPSELKEATFSLGASRWQTATRVVLRQVFPGLTTAVLIALGRGLGDAASVLFTAGYTDRLTTSLLQPVATLPLAIFFQLNSPFPEVQQRAYASAAILTLMILAISLAARFLGRRLGRHRIK
jgi:phosphate transport system permease protein